MIRFDSALLEKSFPELDFRVGHDDNKNPFLAYAFWDGDYQDMVWSFENIRWDEKSVKWTCEVFNYVTGMDEDKQLAEIQLDYFEKFINTVHESILESSK